MVTVRSPRHFLSKALPFFLVAATFPVFVCGISRANTEVAVGPLPLDLKKSFESADVVIVGWTHLHTNTVVPSVLAQALQKGDIERDRIAMVVEHEPDKPTEAYAKGGPAYLGLLGNALDLKMAIFPGDLPDRSVLMKKYNMTPEQLKDARDKHFADVAYDLVTSGKKKVLFIVGNTHVPGIAKNLRERKVSRIEEIQTHYDFATGEVRVGERYWGRGETDSMLYAQNSEERLIKELGEEWRALDPAAKAGDAKAAAQQVAIIDRMEDIAKNFKAANRIFEERLRPLAYRWAEEFRARTRTTVFTCMDVFSPRR